MRWKALFLFFSTALVPGALVAQVADSLETRVWLDRGDDPVLSPGDEVRVYYRASQDAYVAIFRIDTDGMASLVFPQHPEMEPAVRAERDYRLLFPQSARWRVEDDPGVGYFFIVASPEPLDFSRFGYDPDLGWDLAPVGETVYEDPYVAIDDYVAEIVPDWEFVPFALDFIEYDVGEEHGYPRFLCYDCHTYQSYGSWNPYLYDCPTYRVVVWNDPYYSPRYRYVGTRIAYARPLGPRPRYGVVARTGPLVRGPLVLSRAAPPRRAVTYKEPARGRSAVTPLRRPQAVRPPPGRSQVGRPPAGRRVPGITRPSAAAPDRRRPTLQRRPSTRGVGSAVPPRSQTPRVAPPRTPRAAPRGVAPGRPSGRVAPPRSPRAGVGSARPGANRAPPPRAAPSRGPARPRAAPSRGSATSRPGGGRPPPRARPTAPPRPTTRGAPARGSATRGAPPRSGGRARGTPRRRPGGRGG